MWHWGTLLDGRSTGNDGTPYVAVTVQPSHLEAVTRAVGGTVPPERQAAHALRALLQHALRLLGGRPPTDRGARKRHCNSAQPAGEATLPAPGHPTSEHAYSAAAGWHQGDRPASGPTRLHA